MTWKKYFTPVDNSGLPLNIGNNNDSGGMSASTSRYASWLPEVYAGSPNRLIRMIQYDQMDQDPEINTALDTIAEFGTQDSEDTNLPFVVEYNETPSATESEILTKTLDQWCNLNRMYQRAFRIFRSTIKYGDQFFIRDPETYQLYWIDPANVDKIVADESTGSKILAYYVKNISENQQELVATDVAALHKRPYGSGQGMTGIMGPVNTTASNYSVGATNGMEEGVPIDAKHIVHLSLTEGMDSAWPFGISILESVFKIFKQKELLEDSIIIYRVHRAPERRVFMIDVGNMAPTRAQQYIEQVKYEVQQKRVPNKKSDGSNVADAAYNPMCLDLSTRIPLLDGRTLPLIDLIDEYQNGRENWVYSTDPVTGKVMPGNITWAGITRKNTETIKLTLDNGEEIVCTPDHKIPVLGRGFVEAQNLTHDDPLISFETREKSLSSDKDRSYTQVYDHETNTWKYVHRVVAEFFKDLGKHQVMTFDEQLADDEEQDKRILETNRARNQRFNFTQEMLTEVVDKVKKHNSNRLETIELLNNDDKFIALIKEANPVDPVSTQNAKNNKFTPSKLNHMYDKFGYQGWKDFKAKTKVYNHRVVKIEKVANRDVGTITVDFQERWHNHHTFALEAGIFVKNSMLEDYFFAQTADGRGSKVDTLPGGENLGEIDDLKYFNNRLARGLRVPSSYLPTGPDDGTATYHDGKVGVAYIQEYRFATYVERLQRQIQDDLDREFKRYLKWKGINIDSGMFYLKFTPPMNFSRYRDIQIKGEQINLMSQSMGIPFLSNQFKLRKYLGLSEDEIRENERYWKQENGHASVQNEVLPDMRGAGVLPDVNPMMDDLDGGDLMDMDLEGGEADMADMGDMGGEMAGGDLGTEPPAEGDQL